jgi:trigger factor
MVHVSIDELDEKGEILEDGISNSTMILVSYLKKQEIQDQIIGLKVGDHLDFNPLEATESEAETASMLNIDKDIAANITQQFRFGITKIEHQEPAEMGEELYKIAFPKEEIKSEEDFKNRVKQEMEKAYDIESERLFSRFAMDSLFANTTIDLPDEFMKRWLFVSNEGKVPMDEIENNYEGYQKAMKMELLENNLIKKNENLKVSDADLKAEIKNYFKGYFMPNPDAQAEEDPALTQQLDQIAENYLQKNKEESNRIHDELFSRRLASSMTTEMKINEKEVSYQDFVGEIEKITNHDHDHDHDHDHQHENENDAEQSDDK